MTEPRTSPRISVTPQSIVIEHATLDDPQLAEFLTRTPEDDRAKSLDSMRAGAVRRVGDIETQLQVIADATPEAQMAERSALPRVGAYWFMGYRVGVTRSTDG